MGGCTSKPKTTEYEGLMDPHAKGYEILGRNSMDTDNGRVDPARQSEDSGLKAFGRTNSAQKGSERSLQNLFVKQQERGDANLEADNDTTLRDVLRSIGDPKKQTIACLNPETNPVKAEESKTDSKAEDGFVGSGEEATVTNSRGNVEGATDSISKNNQEEPAPAALFQDVSAHDQASLSSKQAEEADKECAAAAETEPQVKNGPMDLEPREMLQELVICADTQSPCQEHSRHGEESCDQTQASDIGVEVVKPVDSGLTMEESSVSDTITSSQAPEVAQAIAVIHTPTGSDGSLEMKTEAFDEPKAAAPEEKVYEGVSVVSEESGRMEEKIEGKSSAKAITVEESDLTHENATSREAETLVRSKEASVVVANEYARPAEDGTEAFGLPTEFSAMKSLDNGAATTESSALTETCDQVAPTKELEGQDQSSVVPSLFTDWTERSRTEAADKRRDDEECAEILPGVEGSLPVDSSTIAEVESAEFSVQDEPMNQMSTVDELQPRLVSNENPEESPISQAGTPSTSVEGVDSDINASELNLPRTPENSSEEKNHTLPETEFNPKGASVNGNGSELPPKVKSDIVITETDSTDFEPARLQTLMHPEQDWRAGTLELGESEAVARQEVIDKGDIQEIQQSDVPSTQDGPSLSDQLPCTADQVVEVPQGFQVDSGLPMGIEEQHQGISQPRECFEVSALKVLPEMKSGEGTENEVRKKPISSEEVSTKDVTSSDIDQVLEKLASEFERQASAEMGGQVCSVQLS